MTDITDDMARKILQAIADPGHFVKRGGDYTEPIPEWSARAVVLVLNEWLAGRVVVDLPEPDERIDDQTVRSLRPQARWHGEDYTVSGIACSFGPKVNVRGGPYMDPDVAEWYGVALIAASREARRLAAEVSGGVGGDPQ